MMTQTRKNGNNDRAKAKEQPWPRTPINIKSLTEVTIEKDNPKDVLYFQRAPVLILHVGSHSIEVTATSMEPDAAAWAAATLHAQRGLHRGGTPLLVSLCAFKGLPEGDAILEKGRTNPAHPLNPYRVIAVCLGGSHVLFYRLSRPRFSLKPLNNLLEEKKAVVVGLGIGETAKKLLHQSGLRITSPVDLRDLVANAHGQDAAWWPKKKKGALAVDGPGLLEMAKLALNGIRLEKTPNRVSQSDWGHQSGFDEEEREMDLIMYAARDAYLSYEIAAKCIEMTGLPPKAITS